MARPRVSVEHHNRVLRAATKRALELEGRFVRILTPILNAAADEAASRFERFVTEHIAASAAREADAWTLASLGRDQAVALVRSLTLTAAVPGVTSRSTMICVKPRPDEAAAVADPDGTTADDLHVTLVYLGETDGPLQAVADILADVAATHAPLTGVVAGYGQFEAPDGSRVGILLPDVPGLVELRVAVTDALVRAGVDYARSHGFEAHITIDPDPEPDELDETLGQSAQAPLHFDSLLVVRGDTEVVDVPLVGMVPLTAAGNEPPKWTPPLPGEVLDIEALVAALRARTEPVRLAVAKTVIGAGVEQIGLSFDAKNPHTRKVIEQSGSQITNVAETTKQDAMRVIKAAYIEGLSIDNTAKAIRASMREATMARATLIARTELAGVVNGGSIAAARIVETATGASYDKTWLTADGARFPRHAEYDGLDGQTVPLGGTFDVGGAQLDHPGDPSGPPEEICNCRCAVVYADGSEAEAEE